MLKFVRRWFVMSLIIICSFCDEPSKVNAQSTSISNDFLTGRFNPAKQQSFSKVPAKYAIRKNLYLQKKTISQFIKMAASAKKQNVDIYIVSATRNFWAQKSIWQRKFKKNQADVSLSNLANALKILHWSSMPGTSRHHWGTDFDIVFSRKVIRLANTIYNKGQGLKTYQWMSQHAAKFGFCQPYKGSPQTRENRSTSNKFRQRGYQQEKWHWSYRPLSVKFLQSYKSKLAQLKPRGFLGDSVGKSLFADYVFNISKDCQ